MKVPAGWDSSPKAKNNITSEKCSKVTPYTKDLQFQSEGQFYTEVNIFSQRTNLYFALFTLGLVVGGGDLFSHQNDIVSHEFFVCVVCKGSVWDRFLLTLVFFAEHLFSLCVYLIQRKTENYTWSCITACMHKNREISFVRNFTQEHLWALMKTLSKESPLVKLQLQ